MGISGHKNKPYGIGNSLVVIQIKKNIQKSINI